MEKHVFTVQEVNHTLKQAIENSNYFKNIYVRGEISNLVFNKSGHVYFSLKDAQSSLGAMIWKSNASKFSKLKLQEGMEIICYGRITYYVPNGKTGFEVSDISVEGVGDLQVLFDQRLAEITALGWTDVSLKQPIPRFVKNIGIVTADTGAAVKDLITTIHRRMPLVNIFLFPAMVQGEFAKFDIAKKIQQANSSPFNLDVIIVGRGGGSYEDLWSFNEIEVLKAVVDAQIPIISAVGHEPDITLIDYVADLRAPTPTAAGELATPNITELLKELAYNYQNQKQAIKHFLANSMLQLNQAQQENILKINSKIGLSNNDLKYYYQSIVNLKTSIIQSQHLLIENIEAKQLLLNPKKPFEKGYGLVLNKQNQIIRAIADVHTNDLITIQIKGGNIKATINEVNKDGK